MKQFISRFCNLGHGWTAQVNLTFDNETLEVLNEEVVCTHKDVNYNTQNNG